MGAALGAALLTAAGWVQAKPPSAAQMDWVPKDKLPADIRDTLPPYCEGTYVQPPLPALPPGADKRDANGDLPVFASGDHARYEMNTKVWLTGNVDIRQGDFQVKGGSAVYDQKAGKVSVQGPLISRGKGFLLTGDKGTYDVHNGHLNIQTASFLIHAADMRGDAQSLDRPAADRMDIHDGTMTTCGPGHNDWSLEASTIHLYKKEGYGTASNVRLHVEDVPVFYFPWISFPIDSRRKSGFLYPAFGSSNTGHGLFTAVPYYFNLAPNYDLTYTPQYISGRGLFSEAEGRYLNHYGQSTLSLGYINSDKQYSQDNPGKSGDRWGANFLNNSSYGDGWGSNIDYSVVSDDNYITDLNRTLSIDRTTYLTRQGLVTYSGSDVYFETLFHGYQVLDANLTPAQQPYSQLPSMLLSTDWQKGLFEFTTDNEYDYFYRNNSDLTGLSRANGSRLRTIPKLALNFDRPWGYAHPSVLMDYTRYQLVGGQGVPTSVNRSVPFYQLDAGLYFDRLMDFFGSNYNQTLEPRLYYVYSPARNQDNIPVFDTTLKTFNFDELFSRDRFSGGDRVGDNNRLTLALTTRFNNLDTGDERARFSIGQVYYYGDRTVDLNGAGTGSRSDSPLAGEAVLRPLDNLDLSVSELWDPRTRATEQSRAQMTFHSTDYRYLFNFGRSYDAASRLEQTDVSTVFPVTDRLSLIGRWLWDSETNRTTGTLAGIEYTTCCWSAELVQQGYLTSANTLENRWMFQVTLKGLGSGGGAGPQLNDAIYGFEERQKLRYANVKGTSGLP